MSEQQEFQDYEEPETIGEGQSSEHKSSLIEKLTNTSIRYLNLWRQLRGYAPDGRGNWKKGKELAGEEFANKSVSSFSAVVNDTNTLTKKPFKECKKILHDAVETFIMDAYFDETVDDNDIFVLAKTYEHNLELFLGGVEAGHFSKVLTAIMTGQKLEMEQVQNKDSFMDYLRGSAK